MKTGNSQFQKMLHERLPEILIALVALIPFLYIAFSPSKSMLNWYSNDDAYFYFKVAQNIASGNGSTFDGIGLTNGYHPLWLLICIPIFTLAKFDLILPLRVIIIVSACISILTGLILHRLLSRRLSKRTATFIALFWIFSTTIHKIVTVGGMESGISSLFIVWLLYRISAVDHKPQANWLQPKVMVTGLIAALAIMSRLDNIFLAIIAGVWLIFDQPKVKSQLVLDIALLPIILVASYFLRLGGANGFFFYAQSAYWFLIVLLIIKIPTLYFLGFYNTEKISITALVIKLLLAITIPAVISFVTLLVLQKFGVVSSFPRTIVVVDGGLTVLWLLLTRKQLIFQKASQQNTIFIHDFDLRQLPAKIKMSVSYALPNAIILGIYVTVNKIIFGTFTPVSGQVKHWWSSLVNPIYGNVASNFGGVLGFPDNSSTSWLAFLAVIRYISVPLMKWFQAGDKTGRTMMDILAAVIILALILLLLRKSIGFWVETIQRIGIQPLLAACLLQVLYYGISGYVHTRTWYWIGELVLFVLFIAIVADAIVQKLYKKLSDISVKVVFLTASLFVIIAFYVYAIQNYPYVVSDNSENPFIEQARFVEIATDAGTLIGTTGGGGLSYFIEGRTIINLDGLMNSTEYFELLKSGEADKYLDKIGLDYVYEKKYVVEESDPYRVFLPEHLTRIGRISKIPLYEYVPGGH